MFVDVSPEAAVAVGAQLLSLGHDHPFNDADRLLLEKIGCDALADLYARLGSRFGVAKPTNWVEASPGEAARAKMHSFEICDDTRQLNLVFHLSPGLFASFVRSTLPVPQHAPLGSGSAALADVRVAIGASLGSCRISAAELSDLATGDVLRLDQPLSVPLELLVSDRTGAGTCAVIEAPGGLALQISKTQFR
ncbi:FliM/FliN family flagellar motor C-terminal domain-containing protein [Sphingosinithalassobacter portus]|uniref:FliM/FliN family flagellar motor C-terminal domain-containing protein n=1 Tax=Stakelama portus TaxID=2676234 RepID=UPI00137B887B|nr:FliM/FliN family flagellar motor C-terminal domain-containing protein [Sphingosinithalassobacter portus]